LTPGEKPQSVWRSNGVSGWKMRLQTIAVMLACAGVLLLLEQPAHAREATGIRLAQAAPPETVIVRRRPPRIRVFPKYYVDEVEPRYNPGPGAVRECNATYVQELRPSGPVIVPHMSCVWRRGY
jgi:hypothetical protein